MYIDSPSQTIYTALHKQNTAFHKVEAATILPYVVLQSSPPEILRGGKKKPISCVGR